jgi:TPR repeat protein
MMSAATAKGPRAGGLALLPFVLSLAVLTGLLLPRVQGNPNLFWAIAGTGGGMVLWHLLLWLRANRSGRPLQVEPVPPVRQHWIQTCVQFSLYTYWGWFWVQDGQRPIYVQAPLILIQFAFVFAFDGLLAWTRGRTWRLASGPAPIVMSTNLFIWFKDDWFAFQFAMVAAGLLGKEFVKWTKDGRRTHVFNPSGFGLACAATVLIATGSTDLTWAKPLATTIEVPGIFLFLFGLGLVVQHFFAVTLMTFAAAVAMVAVNLLYTQTTGVYLFASTNLPAAAFLGLHLLMTDPSTSPRTNVGRALFGAGYGLGYIVVFQVLGAIGAPELFAKLYPVPILNCCVQWLDRLARGRVFGRLNAAWEGTWSPRATNAMHMVAWAAVCAVLFGTGYVGGLRGEHPGNSIAFWKRAVADGKHDAERKLAMVAGSLALASPDPAVAAAAYNELGILSLQGSVDTASAATKHKSAANWWAQAAARGSRPALENIVMHFLFDGLRRSDQELDRALRGLESYVAQPDGRRAAFLLGLAHETGGARPENLAKALEYYRRCGDDPFAGRGIARIGLLPGSWVDLASVAPQLTVAATQGDGESCWYLAHMYANGRGVGKDRERALQLAQKAVAAGFVPAVEVQAKVDPGVLVPYVAPRRKHLGRPAWSSAVAPGS